MSAAADKRPDAAGNKRGGRSLLAFGATQPVAAACTLLSARFGLRSTILEVATALLLSALGVCAVVRTRRSAVKPGGGAVLRALCLLFTLLNALAATAFGSMICWLGTLPCVVCAVILAARGEVGGAAVAILRILSAFAAMLAIAMGLGRPALLNLGVRTVVQRAVSPDGRHCAELIDVDEGALGGATRVEVHSAPIRLGEGELWLYAREVYSDGWQGRENLQKWTFGWMDGETLEVNGAVVRL